MAGLAHLGVGLATKGWAPKVNVGYLILGAYAIDVIWGVFYFTGLEQFPKPGVNAIAPWSHGLFMAILWSALLGFLVWRLSRTPRLGWIFGLLVFSHWVVDFITQPMGHAFPNTVTGVTLLFNKNQVFGLGLYNTSWGTNLGEYGAVAVGAVLYTLTKLKIRQQQNATRG